MLASRNGDFKLLTGSAAAFEALRHSWRPLVGARLKTQIPSFFNLKWALGSKCSPGVQTSPELGYTTTPDLGEKQLLVERV